KFGVDVEYRLHVIVPGGNFLQAAERVSERARVDRGGFARLQMVNVQAEQRRGISPETRLEPRFGIALPGDDHEYASGYRLGVGRGRERDFEFEIRSERPRPAPERKRQTQDGCE